MIIHLSKNSMLINSQNIKVLIKKNTNFPKNVNQLI
jgi:hypothetical protein